MFASNKNDRYFFEKKKNYTEGERDNWIVIFSTTCMLRPSNFK